MTTTERVTIGQKIRATREEQRLSMNDLAIEIADMLPRRCRVTGETIRHYELGEGGGAKGPDPVILAAIAVALDVPLDELAPEVAEEAAMVMAVIARATEPPTPPIGTLALRRRAQRGPGRRGQNR